MNVTFSKAEATALIEFLEDYSDRLGNDGCNDYEILDTPENRELVKQAEAEDLLPGETWEPSIHNGKIMTTNFLVVDALIENLKKAVGN